MAVNRLKTMNIAAFLKTKPLLAWCVVDVTEVCRKPNVYLIEVVEEEE